MWLIFFSFLHITSSEIKLKKWFFKTTMCNTLNQLCTTQIPWRVKKYFFFKKNCQNLLCTYNWHFSTETSLMNKILSSAGQIKSLCGPQLARGPYVVHKRSKTLIYFIIFFIFVKTNKKIINRIIKKGYEVFLR